FAFWGVADSREQETIEKLKQLKRAIVGDPRIVTKESRTDFGHVGDIGSVPVLLTDLWIQGTQPAFTFDNTAKMGAGWQGPYIPIGPVDTFNQLALDGWGFPIQYIAGAGSSAVTGQQYNARLISVGPNGAIGGGDDLTMEIYKTEMSSTVVGYVRDAQENPLTGVNVKMNYVANGMSTSQSLQTDATGAYTFTDI